MKNVLSRRDFLKYAGIGTAGITAAVALAACSDKTEGGETNNTAPATENTGNTPVVQQDEVVKSDSDFVAEKVVIQVQDPQSLEPFGSLSKPLHYVYESLGGANQFSGELKGTLMESWEQKDDRTYAVKLYEDIFDTNNNQIKASDVKFCLEATQANGKLSDVNDIEEIKVTGDYTFDMVLKENPALGSFDLMCEVLTVISQASYEASADGMATTPVGTGPYKLDKYVTSSEVVYSINENYWNKNIDLYTEMQNVKVIDQVVLSETSQIAMALQNHTIDFSQSVNAQDLPSFREGGAFSDGNAVYTMPGQNASVLCLNGSKYSQLGDINLRKAIVYAIDRELVAASVNGGNSLNAYVFGGPGFPDYNAEWEKLLPEYDAEKAKEFLKESSYDGSELEFAYISGNSAIEDAGVIIQQGLANVGIKAKLDGQQLGNFLTAEHDPAGWDFVVVGFGGSGYITNVWRKYFDVNSAGSQIDGVPCTKNFVVDDKLQELISTASAPATHTQENVNACWEYIVENYWILPLFLPTTNYVYNNKLISSFGFDFQNTAMPQGFTYIEG